MYENPENIILNYSKDSLRIADIQFLSPDKMDKFTDILSMADAECTFECRVR